MDNKIIKKFNFQFSDNIHILQKINFNLSISFGTFFVLDICPLLIQNRQLLPYLYQFPYGNMIITVLAVLKVHF